MALNNKILINTCIVFILAVIRMLAVSYRRNQYYFCYCAGTTSQIYERKRVSKRVYRHYFDYVDNGFAVVHVDRHNVYLSRPKFHGLA